MNTPNTQKKNTALMDMIEFMEGYEDGMPNEFYIIEMKKRLPQEKNDLIDANNKGWEDGRRERFNEEQKHFIDGEDYFNQTFKQSK